MAKSQLLPLNERLQVAGQLVVRTRIFYDAWWFYAGADTRPQIIDEMNSFSEFFRFDEHAHFVSFVVHAYQLWGKHSDEFELPDLVREVAPSIAELKLIEEKIAQIGPIVKKVSILRHNLFGHRNKSLSYSDVFKKAAVTPDELRELTEGMLVIINKLLKLRSLKEVAFSDLLNSDLRELFKVLKHQNAA